MAVEHVLKCWPVYFDAVKRGEKPFEVRRDDRGFQKGDTVRLQRTREDKPYEVEYDIHFKCQEIVKRISYILTGGQFGIEPGFVVLGLEDVSP